MALDGVLYEEIVEQALREFPNECCGLIASEADVPVKVFPVMITVAPTDPEVGLKLTILGLTLKLVALAPVPPSVVTDTGPVMARLGTFRSISPSVTTVNVGWAIVPPLNLAKSTSVAPVNPEPRTLMSLPTGLAWRTRSLYSRMCGARYVGAATLSAITPMPSSAAS